MKRFHLFIAAFAILFGTSAFAQKKVACVGDSMTEGYGLSSANDKYSAQLQKLLGNDYEVQNFGYSGASVCWYSPIPYYNLAQYKESHDYAPDIVVIMLGLNDTQLGTWTKYNDLFEDDYKRIAESYVNLPSKPKVYCVVEPYVPYNQWSWAWGFQKVENYNQMVKLTEQVAKKLGLPYNNELNAKFRADEKGLYNTNDGDSSHPNAKGAKVIAEVVYDLIK